LPFDGFRGSSPPVNRSPQASFDDGIEPRARFHHSDSGRPKKRSGKEISEAGKEYEEQVRQVTGGKSEIIDGAEVDSVTDKALIQAKDINPGKPENFLKGATKRQIKRTIQSADKRGLRAEFWFKKEPFPEIRQYIETRGGVVVVGLGE
jgi:hypothetical protein